MIPVTIVRFFANVLLQLDPHQM